MTSFEEVDARSLAELREAGVGSSKWDTFPDAIGSFIAESDYGTAPAVRRVVAEQLERQSFGYVTKAAKAEYIGPIGVACPRTAPISSGTSR